MRIFIFMIYAVRAADVCSNARCHGEQYPIALARQFAVTPPFSKKICLYKQKGGLAVTVAHTLLPGVHVN